MFDFTFTEIALIGVVSLVVLGPEKMPGAVRSAALMIGRLKRTFSVLKDEIEKEIGADDIRRQLRNEEIMERFKETQQQIQNTVDDVNRTAEEIQRSADLEAQTVANLENNGSTPPATEPSADAAAVPDQTAINPAPVTSPPDTIAAPATDDAVTKSSN